MTNLLVDIGDEFIVFSSGKLIIHFMFICGIKL